MMDVLVKYCGGCNPRYDRGKVVENLKEKYPDVNFVTGLDSTGQWDLVLVLSGCTSSCTNHEALHGKSGKVILKSLGEYQALLQTLDEMMDTKK